MTAQIAPSGCCELAGEGTDCDLQSLEQMRSKLNLFLQIKDRPLRQHLLAFDKSNSSSSNALIGFMALALWLVLIPCSAWALHQELANEAPLGHIIASIAVLLTLLLRLFRAAVCLWLDEARARCLG